MVPATPRVTVIWLVAGLTFVTVIFSESTWIVNDPTVGKPTTVVSVKVV